MLLASNLLQRLFRYLEVNLDISRTVATLVQFTQQSRPVPGVSQPSESVVGGDVGR